MINQIDNFSEVQLLEVLRSKLRVRRHILKEEIRILHRQIATAEALYRCQRQREETT